MLCFLYLASKADSNVGQRKYINSGACSMGGSDPFQIHNSNRKPSLMECTLFGEKHSFQLYRKKKTQRERAKPRCTNI